MPVEFDGFKFDSEARRQRSENLGAVNGIRQIFVTLAPAGTPTHALLDVEFFNANHLAGPPPAATFTVTGGVRRRAGPDPGEVRVTQVQAGAGPNVLRLRVEPIGDYSVYTLHVPQGDFDPLFSAAPFKFRPGCFNLNCAPDWAGPDAPADEPAIDYLAKDYDSFRHVMMTWVERRVPDWRPTSEADLDQVLIDLVSADADELSDFQDRVMNEAFFPRVRKRVSLARHARLMDYHVHQGNQASTWLALILNTPSFVVPRGAGVWSGVRWNDPQAVIFAFVRDQLCQQGLNELELYRWDDTVTALEAGATAADLTPAVPLTTAAQANALVTLLQAPEVTRLLIEEVLNPETGTANGHDKTARQILRLSPPGPARAQAVEDPVAGRWCVRVRWLDEDALTRRYCFVTRCTGQPLVTGVSRFYGNLAEASHGRPHQTTFRAPGAPLGGLDLRAFTGLSEAHHGAVHWGTVCRLPQLPLAYRDTPPGGERQTATTLEVSVSGFAGNWAERIDFIASEGDDEHFIVETDEEGRSLVRFGNGVNGAPLPLDAVVICRYQVGQGTAGNVGADALTGFAPADLPGVDRVWNPLDVSNGRDAEPAAEVLRRAPEAYRVRQLRAVTLKDYAQRAEELTGVANAAARYRWTGSWRTVQVAIDPVGTTVLTPQLRRQAADYLEAVRLIGEDVEILPAVYVPLDIKLRLCAHPRYWPEHLRMTLEMEFSDGWTADGRRGFFHPDQWTFGQALYASQIIGRGLAVPGVDRVLSLSMRRWNPGPGGGLTTIVLAPGDLPDSLLERLDMGAFEIIRVENDPDRLERGRILFEILGGRR
jgi:hypothetical protein